jgi:hypothetical protein
MYGCLFKVNYLAESLLAPLFSLAGMAGNLAGESPLCPAVAGRGIDALSSWTILTKFLPAFGGLANSVKL